MSNAQKITLSSGHVWVVGYQAIPVWTLPDSDAQVIIPVEQLDGLTAKEIGEFVLMAVKEAKVLAYECKLEEQIKYAGQLRSEEVRPQQSGYVYLIHGDGTPWYKIGQSKKPYVRLKQLGARAPFRHRLIHSFAVDDMIGVESVLHSHFAPKRAEGEWFELDADDVALVRGLKCRTTTELLAVLTA